jgi:hypothetical protein
MKRAIVALAAVLALTGCTASSQSPVSSGNTEAGASQGPTATPTPTTAAQGIKALQDAASTMTPAQKDSLFLAGLRSSVTTGTDAELIAVGHKMCDDFAAGLDLQARVKDVVAAGFPDTSGILFVASAGIVYCPA